MGKCFTTILGQSDWLRHCYWHSCLTYSQSRRHRGILWDKPPNLKYEDYKLVNFVNFYNVKASKRKQKTQSNHNVGWFPPRDHVATTPFRVEISRYLYSRVWVIFAENLNAITADKCSPSLAVGTWTSFCSVWWWTGSTALSGLKVHVLSKMLWPFSTSAGETRSKPFLAEPEF